MPLSLGVMETQVAEQKTPALCQPPQPQFTKIEPGTYNPGTPPKVNLFKLTFCKIHKPDCSQTYTQELRFTQSTKEINLFSYEKLRIGRWCAKVGGLILSPILH